MSITELDFPAVTHTVEELHDASALYYCDSCRCSGQGCDPDVCHGLDVD